jgi:hypothetical protein
MRGFEGGQMPLHRRLPKRGFTNPFKKQFAVLNLGRLEKLSGDVFTPESLVAAGVLRRLGDGLKILGGGELKRKISVSAQLFSAGAEKRILALGGAVEKLPMRVAAPKGGSPAAPASAAAPTPRAEKAKTAKPKAGAPKAAGPKADAAQPAAPAPPAKRAGGAKTAAPKGSKKKTE